jgi:hypothetical protein
LRIAVAGRARTSIPLDITLLNQECKGIPHGLVFQGRRFLDQNVRRVCVGRQIIDRIFYYSQICSADSRDCANV